MVASRLGFPAALLFYVAAAAPLVHAEAPPAPRPLDGEWDGSLDLGTGLKLRLAFHIVSRPEGLRATFDSVDQGVYGVPVSSVTRQGDHVRIEADAIHMVIDGDLVDGGRTLAARFSQGSLTQPLVLARLAPGAPPPWPAPAGAAASRDKGPATWSPPSDAAIRDILQARIAAEGQGAGFVVGVIDPAGRRVIAAGERDKGDTRPVDGHTEFEIGSVTKVFTALLLSDMVRRGEVKLEDPISMYLPAGVAAPTHAGKPITLVDLATHTSGLPRLPTNMAPKDLGNPYADYDEARLDAFLSSYALPRDPGATWDYSNLGFGLLGHLLARRAGQDYETLLKARVLKPLGMADTTITMSPDQSHRLAVGHDSSLRPAENWDLGVLAGAGALRSTADDLLTFLAANLDDPAAPLKADLAFPFTVRRPMATGAAVQALGWELTPSPSGEIVEHSGGTGGYRAFVGFNRKTGLGVVVLTNAETVLGADDIGRHILTGGPLAPPPPPMPAPPERHAITLPASALDSLAGRYQLAPQVYLTVTRDGDHLMAQLTGQGPYEIFPESPTAFFWKVVDAQLTFRLDAAGQAQSIVLHQNGRDIAGARAP